MKKTLSMFALASLILGLASCANEISGGLAGDENDLIIKFVVGGASEFDTKAGAGLKASGEQTDKILISEPGDPDEIFLVETVKNLDDVYFGGTPATKGTPVYTENFVKTYPSFTGVGYQYTSATATEISDCSGLTAFTGMASAEFGNIANSPITYAYNFGQKTWPENQSILFFLQAPSAINGLEEGSLAHKYVKAANANQGIDAYNGITEFELTTPADATKQQDILITSKSLRWEDYREKEATRSAVLFYHALAGVKFACSNLGDNITTITNVTLTNIRDHGTCTVTPTFDQEGYKLGTSNAAPQQVTKSEGCVKWDDAADTDYADFVLNVPENVIMVGANNTAGLPSSFHSNGSGNKNLNNPDFEYTFFFIPQTTAQNGEDVELTISYLINGKGPEGTATVPFTRTVKFNGREWKAGVLYTYTLSANHVDVSITDKVKDSVKSDLVIKNTGNTASYIRVALIGNWYDNHSPAQIVCPWGSSEGTFVNFADLEGDYWYKGDDDYYYYRKIVLPGKTVSNKLFETYTVTDSPNDYPDAHLEISILVQAVDANKIANATGWDKKKLTDRIDE